MKCTLSGELTIAAASKVKADLLQALAGTGPLEVDTTQISEIDGAGLQVLLAAFKSAASARIPIVFPSQARGAAVSAGLGLIGLTEPDWNGEDWIHGKENIGG